MARPMHANRSCYLRASDDARSCAERKSLSRIGLWALGATTVLASAAGTIALDRYGILDLTPTSHTLRIEPKSVVIERDAFGVGEHRWNPQLLALAETYGFTPKVCRPYRAKTKGKVERFNRYLKESFIVPLAATLKSSGLKLDVETANAHLGRWLSEVANVRRHATTGERPAVLLDAERAALLPLPAQAPALAAPDNRRVLPRESLQHPLAVYDTLLELAA